MSDRLLLRNKATAHLATGNRKERKKGRREEDLKKFLSFVGGGVPPVGGSLESWIACDYRYFLLLLLNNRIGVHL
ncbi:MAG: hypothetical protein F6K31_21310 [Symploca sp. SIO2G7]|nr:hypothetical protein [Symploca sp. SIO2G7]